MDVHCVNSFNDVENGMVIAKLKLHRQMDPQAEMITTLTQHIDMSVAKQIYTISGKIDTVHQDVVNIDAKVEQFDQKVKQFDQKIHQLGQKIAQQAEDIERMRRWLERFFCHFGRFLSPAPIFMGSYTFQRPHR